MKKMRIGIIGVGGYAKIHLKSIAYCREQSRGELKAAVIRYPYQAAGEDETEAELAKEGVTIYRDYHSMFGAERGKLDLVVVPGGIDQHEVQSVAALEAGFHVLCEKPAAGTWEDGLRMQAAAERSGKILTIGFQYIFSPSISRIKALTAEQQLGKLLKAKTYVLWPRNTLYYKRNEWAGKMQYNGRLIYDSPAQNATSHFLNNMLFIAGDTPGHTAEIAAVYGENYRAKAIESADTQYMRIECKNGVIIRHTATHAAEQNIQPVTEYTYERGKVTWQMEYNGKTSVYRRAPGNDYVLETEFDDGEIPVRDLVYINISEALNTGKLPASHIGNSLQQLLCIEGSFKSSGGIAAIAPRYLEDLPVEQDDIPGEYNTVIRGIEDTVKAMNEQEVGFYEYGLPWARESKVVRITGE